MISLEQVQLLETRITKTVSYVQRITAENADLVSQKAGLQAKLDANQKRIDELELLVMRFKEEQGRIEDGVIAALDRLSQFEEAFENSLKEKVIPKKTAKSREKDSQPEESSASEEIFFEIPSGSRTAGQQNSEIISPEKDESVDDDLVSEGELDIY